MAAREAWLVLGEDPVRVFDEIRSRPDAASRVVAAKEALARAERTAKQLMAVHHPDKNQGDERASERFRMVQDALSSIRLNTSELEKRAASSGGVEDEKMRIVIR